MTGPLDLEAVKARADAADRDPLANNNHNVFESQRDVRPLVAEIEALRAENARLRDSLFDMLGQFAYPTPRGLATGGLSALELAFETLGLPDPCSPETLRAAARALPEVQRG